MSADEIRARLQDCQILVVPYCHADWAWTHTRAWHEARYVHVFERVLETMRDDPGFRWYFDSWITHLRPFLDRRPDLVPELQTRIAEGKIAICGTYANVRPNMVGEETFIRNLIIGRRRFRSMFPEADLSVHADIVDVALGHPQIPQLMSLGGYQYYRCWRPQAGLTLAGVPYEWIWQGLDGSQIVCSRGCYGGMCAPNSVPEGYAEAWDQTVEHLWQTELELVSRHSPTGVLWVSQGMDDGLPLQSHGGDQYLDVPGLMAEWNKREQSPMRFATPLEFYEAVKDAKKALPTMTGTLDPCDVCYNTAWGGNRGLWRKRYVADEELVLAELWGQMAGTADDLTPLWEDLLQFSAHATQWLFQTDFDELDALADLTILKAREAQQTSLSSLSRTIPQSPNTAAIIFNPLPFARTAVVPILITASTAIPQDVVLTDGAGNEVPHQYTTGMEYAGRIWEADALALVELPPLGYTTLEWQPREQVTERATERNEMDNGLVRLDYDGPSITAVTLGSQRFEGAIPWNTIRFHEVDTTAPLHVGAIKSTSDAEWEQGEVAEAGPVRWRHVARGTVAGHPVTLETLLFAGQARVEYRLTCDWQGADGFLAAMWPLLEGKLEADVPFGAEEKKLDDIQWGLINDHRSQNIERQREGMFYARSFVSVSEATHGVTHVNHNGDRYYLRNTAEQTLAHILLNSVGPITQGWEQHVNWQTKSIGRHSFIWSLVFHEGDWRAAGMTRLAASLRRPPQVLLPHGPMTGEAPCDSTDSFLEVSAPNVVLAAFYRDGEASVLRLWEAEGAATQTSVRLPFAPLTASAVDFQGQPDDRVALNLRGSTLDLALPPWTIATIRMTR
ncbi:MAG: hypothetical protein ABFE08_00935 [Armatimonadia bacterium]